MSRNIKISLTLIVLFIVAVLSLFINKLTTPRYLSPNELLVNGYYQFPNPKEFSDFQFFSSNDSLINKDVFKEKWTLIYFGFTRCPAECPVAMSLIKNLYSKLVSKGFDLTDKQVLLVTIDPENDSANQVDKYAKAFNNSFIGMRGERPMLLSLATQLNVMVIEPPKNMHSNHISHLENHSNNILLINHEGKYTGFFRHRFDDDKFFLT